jgi:TatD DNase family protein
VTDAHCHIHTFLRIDESVSKRFVAATNENDWPELARLPEHDVPFFGVHPWHIDSIDNIDSYEERLCNILEFHPLSGVGETGLDRLKNKTISSLQRSIFDKHLRVASLLNRPVVVHGAKCWGEVFKECVKYSSKIPSFLFHGFSRSGGLVKDIVSINGYFSIGPSLLNDHAINYHNLVKTFPLDRILIESDFDGRKELPPLSAITEKLSSLLNIPLLELSNQIEENAKNFLR